MKRLFLWSGVLLLISGQVVLKGLGGGRRVMLAMHGGFVSVFI